MNLSARSNMILTDRAGTPVAHTFTPDGTDSFGNHRWSEKTGIPAGNNLVSARLRETGSFFKPMMSGKFPVVATQTINGVSNPIIVLTDYFKMEFNFSPLTTQQHRADVAGFAYSMLAPTNTQMNDLIVNLSDVY